MAFVVSAIGAAWVAGAAIVGGAAVTAAAVATIAAGVAAAGTVLTVVGKVTKSPQLMKIGKVMSIAGGITALGAGLISSVASAGTSAASAGASNVVPGAAADGLAAGAADAATGAATDAMVNQGVDSAVGSVAQAFPVDGGSALSGLGDAAGSAASSSPNLALSSVPQASMAPVSGQAGMSLAPVEAGSSAIGNIQTASAAVAPSAAPGMLQRAGDWWAKLSPVEKAKITDNVMQMGGKAVGGMFEGWSADKRLEIEEEIRRENQKRYDTGQKNANFVPVIGFQPRLSGGLINSGPRG